MTGTASRVNRKQAQVLYLARWASVVIGGIMARPLR
jgi:hypothetical protein